MSWPHFLHGSHELIEGVDGLSPDPEKHSFILDVDPVSIIRQHYIYITRIGIRVYQKTDNLEPSSNLGKWQYFYSISNTCTNYL